MDSNERKKTAEKALNEKYGEEFTAMYTERQYGNGFYAWLVPRSISGAVVKAAVNNDGTGAADNYSAVRLSHMITGYVEWQLNDYEKEYCIHTANILEYTEPYEKGLTAGEYLRRNAGDRFDISIIVAGSGSDCLKLYSKLTDIREKLRSQGISAGYIDVYSIERDLLEELQAEISRYDSMNTMGVKRILSGSGKICIPLDSREQIPTEDEFMKGLIK